MFVLRLLNYFLQSGCVDNLTGSYKGHKFGLSSKGLAPTDSNLAHLQIFPGSSGAASTMENEWSTVDC